jgi:hypothetical protein
MKKFIITSLYSQARQASIQGGHASDELALAVGRGKYTNTPLADIYWDWNEQHKTYVDVEVGSPKDIISLFDWLRENEKELQAPSAIFKEEALNDSVTALSFVAPSKLCLNIQHFVSAFLKVLQKKHKCTSFSELKGKSVHEIFNDAFLDFSVQFQIEDEVITVRLNDSEEDPIEYTFAEFDFFVMFRHLRLKN